MADDDKITITIPSSDGDVEYDAWAPTPEQLLVFASEMQNVDTVSMAIMHLLEDVFEPADYQTIRNRLRGRRNDPNRLQVKDLEGVIEQLMESLTDFPTEPSSASPATPTPTGRRSTGRVHSPASTPSRSAAVAS